MAGPIIYIFTMTIKPGKVEEARKHIAEQIDFVETNEPRMIAFHCFFDEEGSKLRIGKRIPANSASIEFHMEVSAKHFTTAFDYLDDSSASSITAAQSPKRSPASSRSGTNERRHDAHAASRRRLHPHECPVRR